MKKSLRFISVIGVVSLLFVSFMFIGCGKKSASSSAPEKCEKIVSAEKNSFSEVTSQLNTGGDVYMYMSTERCLQDLSNTVNDFRATLLSMPDLKDDDKKGIEKGFDVVSRLIKNSGVESISGFGMSSIAREKGVFHSRSIVHHYPGKNSGYIWSFFGSKPHALEGLNFAPANTGLAVFFDVQMPLVWTAIKQELGALGIPEIDKSIQEFTVSFEGMTGVKFETLLNSLQGDVGMVLTLDDTKKIPIPMGSGVQVPTPELMLVAKVKDDTIFNRVEQLMGSNPSVIKSDQDGAKMRTMPVPLPLPLDLRPTLARSGDYLFLASTDRLIKEALEIQKGKKPGLKSTDEFKKLSKGVPSEGNGFCFLGKKFGETVLEVQKLAIQSSGKANPAQAQMMQKMMGGGSPAFAYAVNSNTDEGWISVCNGTQDPGKQMVALPLGVLSGIAIPAMSQARERAKAVQESKANSSSSTVSPSKRSSGKVKMQSIPVPVTKPEPEPVVPAPKEEKMETPPSAPSQGSGFNKNEEDPLNQFKTE